MEGRLKKGGEWKGEMWGVELDACGDAAVVCGQGPHAILPERCDPSGCSPDGFCLGNLSDVWDQAIILMLI